MSKSHRSSSPTPRHLGSFRLLATALPAALTLAFFAPACGGSDDDGGGGSGGPIPSEDFVQELLGAQCDWDVKCGFMPDVDTCLASTSIGNDVRQVLSDSASTEIDYDANGARSCVDAIRARSCDALQAEATSVAQTCDAVFTNRLPAGSQCFVDLQCEGLGATCLIEDCQNLCCLGTCEAPPPKAAIGEACSEALACVDEAFCLDGVCEERLENGQDCPQSGSCQDGMGCDPGSDKCFIRSKAGEPCNPNLGTNGCLSFNTYCSPQDEVCVPRPSAGSECATNGAFNGVCMPLAYCAGGTCEQLPGPSAECTGDGPQCLGDLGCDNGSCSLGGPTVTCNL